MNVFTFDDIYFFDRSSEDDCWYAYTHPAKHPFAHGQFDVRTGTFTRDTGDGRFFTADQKCDIERILRAHKSEMDLKQFEIHQGLPNHFVEIDRRSNGFADFINRLKWMGRTEPKFSIAYQTLTLRNPAYRLTRDFVSQILDQMTRVTQPEMEQWLHEVTKDSWVYDHTPARGETYDDFYHEKLRQLTIPDSERFEVTPQHKLFEIDGLSRLFLLERHTDWGRESVYYVDTGPVFSPTPLPNMYIV